MSFFGNKFDSSIGVDIGSGGIKLVELRRNKGRPQLWTYGFVDSRLDIHGSALQEKDTSELRAEATGGILQSTTPAIPKQLETDEKRATEYAEILKNIIKSAEVKGRQAVSSIPVSSVFHTVINLPKVPPKQVDALVQAEVAKVMPSPLSEMQVVHQQVPMDAESDKKYSRFLVTAAPKSLVAFYTSVFQKAGLHLTDLETEAFALSRSLVGHDSTVSMLIDIGAERTNFSIVDRGLPMTQRSLQIGGHNLDAILAETLQLPIERVGQLKHDLSSLHPDAIKIQPFLRLFEPIVKEIQYHFDLYLHQSGNESKRPEKIVLTGGAALFPPLINYIKQNFPLRVFVGDPWARVIYQDNLKGILGELGPRMAVSIGLALRGFS